MPDLAFFDIQLADGLSFEVFQQIEIECPVVFTTAYDQYALQAFEVNSIDYLLKPIREKQLQRALNKYKFHLSTAPINLEVLKRLLSQNAKPYKKQFVIKVGDHLKTVLTSDATLLSSEDRSTYLYDLNGKKYLLDFTLEAAQDALDPNQFYRVSRKHIVRINAIFDIISFSKSRLKIVIIRIFRR